MKDPEFLEAIKRVKTLVSKIENEIEMTPLKKEVYCKIERWTSNPKAGGSNNPLEDTLFRSRKHFSF